jgi:DNA-binding HxlR family transcriptional regulator
MDENYIKNLIEVIQTEKTKLFNELKNDVELTHTNTLTQKLTALDTMLKGTIKLRNTIIKEKMSFKL